MADEATVPMVLCVDDDADVLDFLKEQFSDRGFSVLAATNGLDACVQLARWHPHAVILDLLMPRLGGLGALARIRALAPYTPVVIMSGVPDMLDVVLRSGFEITAAFLKPVDPGRIATAVMHAQASSPARSTPGSPSRFLSPSRGRVLLVDSRADLRHAICRYFTKAGFETIEARREHDVVQIVIDVAPDVILLGAGTVATDDTALLRRIANLRPHSRIILLADAEHDDRLQAALAPGAIRYVWTPPNLEDLHSLVIAYLGSHASDVVSADASGAYSSTPIATGSNDGLSGDEP
jgi:DNA-binding response OmpR family regulator